VVRALQDALKRLHFASQPEGVNGYKEDERGHYLIRSTDPGWAIERFARGLGLGEKQTVVATKALKILKYVEYHTRHTSIVPPLNPFNCPDQPFAPPFQRTPLLSIGNFSKPVY
jgi:hypothetical protein